MNCSTCGLPVGPGINFCPRCGAAVAAASPPPPSWPAAGPQAFYAPRPFNRVQSHLQTLGILWCVYAGYRILHGLIGMAFLHTFLTNFNGWGDGWSNTGFHPSWLMPLFPVIGVLTLCWAALAAFTGYSLLTRRPWGRTLAIVMAILTLIRIPVGTALGIYTLWALAPELAGAEYQAIAERQ